jgi:hypothetical protein
VIRKKAPREGYHTPLKQDHPLTPYVAHTLITRESAYPWGTSMDVPCSFCHTPAPQQGQRTCLMQSTLTHTQSQLLPPTSTIHAAPALAGAGMQQTLCSTPQLGGHTTADVPLYNITSRTCMTHGCRHTHTSQPSQSAAAVSQRILHWHLAASQRSAESLRLQCTTPAAALLRLLKLLSLLPVHEQLAVVHGRHCMQLPVSFNVSW